ncbi:hypothetical protein FHX80_111250 [Streptomyces brevispora]|uniref:Uncharacterized protein n=1 Tax=Streptomyces brevispora TaxID=887462 RepID=A0A561UU21_9ACTN|nr:hypothetical protein FHX80_111250 [Streptomyces brevispora]
MPNRCRNRPGSSRPRADELRHGYAIACEVEQISGGRVTLRTGTLYGIGACYAGPLDRMPFMRTVRPTVHTRLIRRTRIPPAHRAALTAALR